MKRRIPFVVAFWLAIDIYFFDAVRVLTQNNALLWGYWLADILVGAAILYVTLANKISKIYPALFSALMSIMLLSFVPKLFGVLILLHEDITRLFRGFPPRIKWVSEVAAAVAAIPFVTLLFGLTRGRHFYQVCKETLYFEDLPEAFDGFTITQISDIHSGSFTSKKGVEKGIELVNAQNSDVILFTGDLVNNKASEMDSWIPAFSNLKAPYGKFSVLGNHDYGDYVKWDSKEKKYANHNRLEKVHEEIGFRFCSMRR